MKQKTILSLILIGLTSFNFIGCINSTKDITPKNEQQENISTENNKANEKDITKTANNSDNKITETNKIKNNTNTSINKNSQNATKEVNNKNTEKSGKENNATPKTQESTKQIYKDKLDTIELGMKDLADLKAGGTWEMRLAARQEYERWDNALNEIYSVLQKQLSSDDMNKLKNEEIKWISYRDDESKKASLQYKGGTAEPLIYGMALAQTTKERCYELVEKYMK
ncbi:lysozyme inhibitor LprI family protein [uncultured Clostridium sp.]|uniref:lysozyme inhibitor LprI family protein n=1 Tax=uncultured Clostridium sp. TaxID=59620 RepID=UPI0028E4BEFA|nr:lysozyme inhibitor LprI family protein [uncultured Clostridium sp.]